MPRRSGRTQACGCRTHRRSTRRSNATDLAAGDAVDPRFVWAALDCPSGIACMRPGAPIVLASMTASLRAPVEPERDYVLTAWPIASEGRKHRAGSALHDADGRRMAVAEALWISLRVTSPAHGRAPSP